MSASAVSASSSSGLTTTVSTTSQATNEASQEKKQDAKQSTETKESKESKKISSLAMKCTHEAFDVHDDDIHALIRSSGEKAFLSGSKDGSLKKWNFKGNLEKTVWSDDAIDYRQWITALSGTDSYWLSGTRDGHTDLWSYKGDHVCSLLAKPTVQSNSHKCKIRNSQRINCLASQQLSQNEIVCYVGWPTQFTAHTVNTSTKQTQKLWHCKTSQNDWVYCVQPLDQKRFLVVTGTNLDLWEKLQAKPNWKRSSIVSPESTNKQSRQRPFISSITPLQANKNHYGLAIFDGSVAVVDVTNSKELFRGKEHQNRVWTIENIDANIFASCADDRSIKLWDVRTPKSVLTRTNKIGRVSTLLLLENSLLVSGLCPDDLKSTKDRARFSFWDIRNG